MGYEQLTIKSKSWLKRFSHRKRFERAIALLALDSDDIVMDYGTGDAYLLTLINDKYPSLTTVGYEPNKEIFLEAKQRINGKDNMRVFTDIEECLKYSYSKITCLEVLEHLNEKDQIVVLSNMLRMLRKDGRIIVSVPIEIGLSSLLKNIFRLIIGAAHRGTTPSNMLKSFLGMKIKRNGSSGFISSHIGFDYRVLGKVFAKAGFTIGKKYYSPLPLFRNFLNSQILFCLRPAPIRVSRTSC